MCQAEEQAAASAQSLQEKESQLAGRAAEQAADLNQQLQQATQGRANMQAQVQQLRELAEERFNEVRN